MGNPWVLGGAAALVLVLGFLLKSSYERNGELEQRLAQQAMETQECADANATNDHTIMALEAKVDELSRLRAAEAAERERALVERDRELARVRARADQLERERDDEIAGNADCAALNELAVGTFCPDTAGQLRERSRSPGSHGDSDG